MEYPTLLKTVNNLYTNKSSRWIAELDDNEVEPFIIQNWLIMNDNIRILVRWLDKYVFKLPPKMYLSLAWSIIPKTIKPPFINYIKRIDEEEEFDFILTKIRKHMEMSDNDYRDCKQRILKMIKEDMAQWFTFYGIEKKYWKQYYLDYEQMRHIGKQQQPEGQHKIDIGTGNLDTWFKS